MRVFVWSYLIGVGFGVAALVTGFRLKLWERLPRLSLPSWSYGGPLARLAYLAAGFTAYVILGSAFYVVFTNNMPSPGSSNNILAIIAGLFILVLGALLMLLVTPAASIARAVLSTDVAWESRLSGLAQPVIGGLGGLLGYLTPFVLFSLIQRLHLWFVPAPVERVYRKTQNLPPREQAEHIARAGQKSVKSYEPAWVSENYAARMNKLRREVKGKGKRYRERTEAQTNLVQSEADFINDLADEMWGERKRGK